MPALAVQPTIYRLRPAALFRGLGPAAAPAIKDEQRFPVDAKIVVSRTRDGGDSFDVLNRGLQDRHAYDLVYRHALDIDAAGSSLAFGSTSGGLWI